MHAWGHAGQGHRLQAHAPFHRPSLHAGGAACLKAVPLMMMPPCSSLHCRLEPCAAQGAAAASVSALLPSAAAPPVQLKSAPTHAVGGHRPVGRSASASPAATAARSTVAAQATAASPAPPGDNNAGSMKERAVELLDKEKDKLRADQEKEAEELLSLLDFVSSLPDASFKDLNIDAKFPGPSVKVWAKKQQQQSAGSATQQQPFKSSEDIIAALLQRYGQQFSTNKPSLERRSGPIDVGPDLVVRDVGQYFMLAGYEEAVDFLIECLLQLHMDFDVSLADAANRQSYIERLHLLRAIGAPGTGKTTFVTSAWSMVLPRLQQVQQQAGPLWQLWEKNGAEGLLQRLEGSWCTDAHGPLVFVSDLADEDLKEVQSVEKDHSANVQAAARMLWATLDTRRSSGSSISTYNDLLLDLQASNLLQHLRPLLILRFVQQAAGLPIHQHSIVAFVFDEVNNVRPESGQQATFLQQHLSAVVGARLQLVQAAAAGKLNMLPVLVAATTRANAASLDLTVSRKAQVTNLRLPLIQAVDEHVLNFMDVMRRLRLPQRLREQLGGVSRSKQLTPKQQQQLIARCPEHIRQLLQWVSPNVRMVEYALRALTGVGRQTPRSMSIVSLDWYEQAGRMPLPDIIAEVVETVRSNQWGKYLDTSDRACEILLPAIAHALCNEPVTRQQWVSERLGVRYQELELDGMIQLKLAGLLSTGGCQLTSTMRGGLLALPKVRRGSPELVTTEVVGHDPDGSVYMEVQLLTPILISFLRSSSQLGKPAPAMGRAPAIGLAASLVDQWRQREIDDLAVITMRMYLSRTVLQQQVMHVSKLLPALASMPALGEQYVRLPDGGYQVEEYQREVKKAELAGIVNNAHRHAVTASPSKKQRMVGPAPPWCMVFCGRQGPGDSMAVLQLCDAQGKLSGEQLVVHMQSKSRQKAGSAVNWANIRKEAAKVPVLAGMQGLAAAHVHQVFVFITDDYANTLTIKAQQRTQEQRTSLQHSSSATSTTSSANSANNTVEAAAAVTPDSDGGSDDSISVSSNASSTNTTYSITVQVPEGSSADGGGGAAAEGSGSRSEGTKQDDKQQEEEQQEELLYRLAQGEAVTINEGLIVTAFFNNTAWLLRGPVQSIMDMLRQYRQLRSKEFESTVDVSID